MSTSIEPAQLPMSVTLFTEKLEYIKKIIESMTKNHQIEILKILKKNTNTKLNENKSGVFVNLSLLPLATINEIDMYLNYVNDQENALSKFEIQKKEYESFIPEKQ